MNSENGGFLRFSSIGTPPAEMLASPTTGHGNTKVQGNKIMTYEAANVRNALVAVTIAFLASAVLMAGAVGPAIA
jgi:hypothetical protein